MTPFTFMDFTTQEFKRNPFPIYDRLRATEPLHRFETQDGNYAWLVTRYDDAVTVLKDPRFVKDVRRVCPSEVWQQLVPDQEVFHLISEHMLNFDPPDHTRLRRLVSQAFTPRLIEQLRGRIQYLSDSLLDAVQERGYMDLIDEFAYPLPITVISEMLGIPVEDRGKFRAWSTALVDNSGMFRRPTQVPAELEAFTSYLKELVAYKKAQPGADLVSQLVQVKEAGDQLSENELLSMLFLLIVAGHETTVNLIGNGTLALLQHPDQLRALQNDPSLLEPAVEELLRYASPVALLARWAGEDIAMRGKVIPRCELVLVALMASNTDPEEFPAPEDLDITRSENKHLSFGKGIHFCLGAPLARLEGQIALGTLLRRMPQLRLAADPEELTWRASIGLRGLKHLPVRF